MDDSDKLYVWQNTGATINLELVDIVSPFEVSIPIPSGVEVVIEEPTEPGEVAEGSRLDRRDKA
jgi:hypothetical protein